MLRRWTEFLNDYLTTVPPLPIRFRTLDRALLGSAMLVVFLLPILNQGVARYNYDQQRDFCRTVALARGRVSPWTVEGPAGINEWPAIRSSSQMPYLLWVLPVWLWPDQRVGLLVEGFFCAATIWAVTRAAFGQIPIGTLWAIAFLLFLRWHNSPSLPFYHPSLTIPFSALTLYSLSRFWSYRKVWDFVLLLFAAGIGAQMHIGNVFSSNAVFLSLRWIASQRRWVWLLAALFGLGGLFIPYAASRLASGELSASTAWGMAVLPAATGLALVLGGVIGPGRNVDILRDSVAGFLGVSSTFSLVFVTLAAWLSGRHGFGRYFEQAYLPILMCLAALLTHIKRLPLKGWAWIIFVAGWYHVGTVVAEDVVHRRGLAPGDGIFAAIRFLQAEYVTQADFWKRTHWLSHRRTDFSLLSFVPQLRADAVESSAAQTVRVVMRESLSNRLPYHSRRWARVPDTDLEVWSFRSATVEDSLTIRRVDGVASTPLPTAFWDEIYDDDLVLAYPAVFDTTFVSRRLSRIVSSVDDTQSQFPSAAITADHVANFRIRNGPRSAVLAVVVPLACRPTLQLDMQILSPTWETPTDNGEDTKLSMFQLVDSPENLALTAAMRFGPCRVTIFDLFGIPGEELIANRPRAALDRSGSRLLKATSPAP